MTKKKQKASLKVGCPPIISCPDELAVKAEEYFNSLKDPKNPALWLVSPTITGLSLHLGFSSRQSLYDYGKKSEFSYIISKCRLIIESFLESSLTSGGQVTGAVFNLKCNYGWDDKIQQEINNITINNLPSIEIGGEEIQYNIGKSRNNESS